MGYPTTPRDNDEVGSATHGVAVDISAADHVLEQATRAIFVGTGGNLLVKLHGDNATTLTFLNVPDGTLLPIRVKTVVRTSTTAAAMIALF